MVHYPMLQPIIYASDNLARHSIQTVFSGDDLNEMSCHVCAKKSKITYLPYTFRQKCLGKQYRPRAN